MSVCTYVKTRPYPWVYLQVCTFTDFRLSVHKWVVFDNVRRRGDLTVVRP